jgi:hypothetical protein
MSFFNTSSTSSFELASATIALPWNFNGSPSLGTSSSKAPMFHQHQLILLSFPIHSMIAQSLKSNQERQTHRPSSKTHYPYSVSALQNAFYNPGQLLSNVFQNRNEMKTKEITYGRISILLASFPG